MMTKRLTDLLWRIDMQRRLADTAAFEGRHEAVRKHMRTIIELSHRIIDLQEK